MVDSLIRNFEEELMGHLRIRASRSGKSMQQEAGDTLRSALDEESPAGEGFIEGIRARFAELGGVELEMPPRDYMREPPNFE